MSDSAIAIMQFGPKQHPDHTIGPRSRKDLNPTGFLLAPPFWVRRNNTAVYFLTKTIMKKFTTINEATALWVEQWFHHIPASSVDNLSIDIVTNISSYGDEIMLHEDESFCLAASPRTECLECGSEYKGKLKIDEMYELWEKGRGIDCANCGADCWRMGYPRERGVLYAPKRKQDIKWILKHAVEVAQFGFYVYQSKDYGVLLGFDFSSIDLEFGPYCMLWIPLYKLRGLNWHDNMQ